MTALTEAVRAVLDDLPITSVMKANALAAIIALLAEPAASGSKPFGWRYKALPMADEPWQLSTSYESIKNASQVQPLSLTEPAAPKKEFEDREMGDS